VVRVYVYMVCMCLLVCGVFMYVCVSVSDCGVCVFCVCEGVWCLHLCVGACVL